MAYCEEVGRPLPRRGSGRHAGSIVRPASRPELRNDRTRVKTPGQNGVRERACGSLKYKRLYREQIDDAMDLVRESDAYRHEFNTVRPHEALAWNRPAEVHSRRADPVTPTFPDADILPIT